MTRINWDEVHQLKRLDEIIAYSIITLQEAYTAPNNDDLDSVTKQDIHDWVRWEITYDEQGRAYFRYAASLYVVDKNPLANRDFLELINSPTRYLVNHATVTIDERIDDTSLKIDPLVDIPADLVNTMEKLLFWAIVLGDWWNLTLKYIGVTEPSVLQLPTGTAIPISNWGTIVESPGGSILNGEDTSGTIDGQFDSYNGKTDDGQLPDFLKDILDKRSDGTGDVQQTIDLPSKDAGSYRENLTTCAEQDPAITNYSKQHLEALLPTK
jgi:hypothetical protein